jgi:hypothetical protein
MVAAELRRQGRLMPRESNDLGGAIMGVRCRRNVSLRQACLTRRFDARIGLRGRPPPSLMARSSLVQNGPTYCQRVARDLSGAGCHPQKLNECPRAPRNTRGVGHREWSERARSYFPGGDVGILAQRYAALRLEG